MGNRRQVSVGMKVVCCLCKRVKIEEDWVENREACLGAESSHGYCPECFGRAMRAFEAEMAKGRAWQGLKVHGLDSRL